MGCPMGRAMQNLETENFNQDPLHSIRQDTLNSDSTRRRAYVAMNENLQQHPLYTSQTNTIENHRIAFTRVRLASHRLMFERGRWSRIPPENRMCLCNRTQTDQHVLLECPMTVNIRHDFVLNYDSLYDLFASDFVQLANYCCEILHFFHSS